MRAVAATAVVLAATAAFAGPRTTQLTSSDRDSRVERYGVSSRTRWVAVRSTADLTPGAPGNADGSEEVWRVNILTRETVQATDGGAASCVRVTSTGGLVFASRDDLTPGAPGNADGSFEAWTFGDPVLSLRQMTASDDDSFFQTYTDRQRRAYLTSRGDLVPGAPGNADGSYEVFEHDTATGTLRQLTSSPQGALIRGVCPNGDCGILESSGDLRPGGNADGSTEVFLLDLASGSVRQLTSSPVASRFAGTDGSAHRIAIESRGDLVPGGNADGSLEVFVWDIRAKRLTQATSSAGDSRFASFVPASRLVAVTSRTELAPGGDGDGSQEVYVVAVGGAGVGSGGGAARRLTRSAADSSLLQVSDAPRRWAVIRSAGDLAGDGLGTGTADLFAVRIASRGARTWRLTRGDADAAFAGFAARGRSIALDCTADLVPGRNADGSREVFVVGMGRRPRPVQATASAADSFAVAVSPGLRLVLVESRADLVPGGNADGSLEVYAHRFGPRLRVHRRY